MKAVATKTYWVSTRNSKSDEITAIINMCGNVRGDSILRINSSIPICLKSWSELLVIISPMDCECWHYVKTNAPNGTIWPRN